MLRVWARRSALGLCGAVGIGYSTSPGFRRSVTFWSTVAPFVAEYYCIRAHGYLVDADLAQREAALAEFHHQTAGRVVDVVLELGNVTDKLL